MTQQRVGPEKPQTDVGGLGELPQDRRVREVHGTWPPVYERHYDLKNVIDDHTSDDRKYPKKSYLNVGACVCVCVYLSVLQRNYTRVFCGADDVIVMVDTLDGPLTKPLDTVSLRC